MASSNYYYICQRSKNAVNEYECFISSKYIVSVLGLLMCTTQCLYIAFKELLAAVLITILCPCKECVSFGSFLNLADNLYWLRPILLHKLHYPLLSLIRLFLCQA